MKLFKTLTLAALLATTSTWAFATPVLKSDVSVVSAIVTVGDMFDNAGAIAEEALFRAPAPGSTGIVTLDDIRNAAIRVGLEDYIANGVGEVRVARLGTPVDEDMLTRLIAEDLHDRGILTPGMSAKAMFDTMLKPVTAAIVDEPVKLVQLRYVPTGRFTARFTLAGVSTPLEIDGSIQLLIKVPHLAHNLPAGTVLGEQDIVMRDIPLQYAEASGALSPIDLVGKQLERQSREGMMIKASDVTDPMLISRNDSVTVYFRNGKMTLSVQGKALNAASHGQAVAVLNPSTKKVVHGTAVESGIVEISTPRAQMNVAGL